MFNDAKQKKIIKVKKKYEKNYIFFSIMYLQFKEWARYINTLENLFILYACCKTLHPLCRLIKFTLIQRQSTMNITGSPIKSCIP